MPANQSVIVYFEGWIDSLEPVHRLSEILKDAMKASDLGTFDGHEIAMDCSHGNLTFQSKDAKATFNLIKPYLTSADLIKCTHAILRFGSRSHDIEKIVISP